MSSYQIFWTDLTLEAQKRLGHLYHDDINTTPIATIETESRYQLDPVSCVECGGDCELNTEYPGSAVCKNPKCLVHKQE